MQNNLKMCEDDVLPGNYSLKAQLHTKLFQAAPNLKGLPY